MDSIASLPAPVKPSLSEALSPLPASVSLDTARRFVGNARRVQVMVSVGNGRCALATLSRRAALRFLRSLAESGARSVLVCGGSSGIVLGW